ncbi:hypothetical protein [Streptococcus sp. sy018]|uniref:hypothetical protein n=1 Tax=Streptococcus sp. sy018 TaxID=2600147 RepID=UPI0011B72057|nr:hypothetical protein [Streptococcus sp. sy018]TWS94561.1 hypothetical protein FRX52_03585 [Streptococcus sp. sy018]
MKKAEYYDKTYRQAFYEGEERNFEEYILIRNCGHFYMTTMAKAGVKAVLDKAFYHCFKIGVIEGIRQERKRRKRHD